MLGTLALRLNFGALCGQHGLVWLLCVARRLRGLVAARRNVEEPLPAAYVWQIMTAGRLLEIVAIFVGTKRLQVIVRVVLLTVLLREFDV